MTRNSLSRQNTRSAKNPFSLGSFGELTLRYLTGSLGPKNKVISGGYGKGEYNHWYSITLTQPGWIVVIKGGTRPKYINVSAYDLNRNPIEGRSIFDADSVAVNGSVEKFYPYLDTVMGAQSDLYNTYERLRVDKGDERYYPLEKGTYLICVSATRNEDIDYGVGIVIEFPITEVFIMLEDNDGSLMLTETNIDFEFICEPGNDLYYQTVHDHSLSEWRDAWNATHKVDTEPFPADFIPYTNRP